LQEVLEQIYKIERELDEIPKAILTEKEMLTRLKKQFVEKSGNLEKRQLKVKELKSQLKDAEEKRGNYEKQMDVIKTQKEYELLDKAIKETILEEQQLRKDLVKEEKETEEVNLDVEKMQTLVSSQEESIRKEEEKIQSESNAKKKELASLNAKKDKITPGIDEEILFKFERIIKSRGKGIVPVDILKEKDNELIMLDLDPVGEKTTVDCLDHEILEGEAEELR
jgi:predicted  nucleic acid-binding Zn-ribbon protein